MYYELRDRFFVGASVEATWAFFSAAENLPRITPPAMKFRIDSAPPGGIQQDSVLDYTVRVAGMPVRWRTLITSWTPPTQFVDLQIRGPYTVWHHRHTFKPVEGGVECADAVLYRLPGGVIGRVAQPLVRRELLAIFRYRREAIARLLGPVKALQEDVTIEKVR